jgi:hypothetical protein
MTLSTMVLYALMKVKIMHLILDPGSLRRSLINMDATYKKLWSLKTNRYKFFVTIKKPAT